MHHQQLRRTSAPDTPGPLVERPRPHPGLPLHSAGVLALQQGAGSQAVARMLARTEATAAPPQDTGATPGTAWRWLTWAGISAADLAAEVVEACGFEGYDESAAFLKRYMSGAGADYELVVPEDWQAKIAQERQKPGTYRDVSAYKWDIPDMKNSLGHFGLEIEPIAGGGKLYTVTDRYYFPAFVDGKAVHHGFEVDFFGLLPAGVRQSTNDALALLGEWKHPDGKPERFEIKQMGGKWTFILPQQWLADSGQDFNVRGSFVVPPAPKSHAAGEAAPAWGP